MRKIGAHLYWSLCCNNHWCNFPIWIWAGEDLWQFAPVPSPSTSTGGLQSSSHLKNEIKSTEKSTRAREKENHDQKKVIESARDTIKSVKAKISHANICKTKLESENRSLKKQLEKKESQLKVKVLSSRGDIGPAASPSDVLDASTPTPSTSTSRLSSFASMVSHWNPNPYLEAPQRPGSIPSMIAHCSKHPNPVSILISMEEVLQMMREILSKPLFGSKDDS